MKPAALALCASVALVGCGSSPEPTFYALAPSHGAAQPGAPRAIRIRRLAIPPYLDRPEVVRGLVNHRLAIAADERWGAPLDEMLGRVLAEDVEQRSPGSLVFSETGAISVDADATVEVDLQRLEVDPSGEVTLVADVAVERGQAHTASASRAVNLKKSPSAAGTPGLVAAMSDLVGELADQITALLRAG